MRRVFFSLGTVALAACLVTNLIAVRATLTTRIPADRIVGSRRSTPVRRAALYGEDAGQLIADLERTILSARREGHKRIVLSYSGKFSNVLVSTATHAGWPMQVIEQTTPGMKRNERLAKAAAIGATLFISLRPGQGWTTASVAPMHADPKTASEPGAGD